MMTPLERTTATLRGHALLAEQPVLRGESPAALQRPRKLPRAGRGRAAGRRMAKNLAQPVAIVDASCSE